MNILNILMITTGATIILLMIVTLLLNMTRNFFTRSRYVRVETFIDDKTIKVKYYKKDTFNLNNLYLINPNHVFMMKGYTTMIFTQHSNETINPLDFESKFSAELYTSAIQNKLIEQTFSTLKTSKLDLMKILLFANFATIALLIYMIMKNEGIM